MTLPPAVEALIAQDRPDQARHELMGVTGMLTSEARAEIERRVWEVQHGNKGE